MILPLHLDLIQSEAEEHYQMRPRELKFVTFGSHSTSDMLREQLQVLTGPKGTFRLACAWCMRA